MKRKKTREVATPKGRNAREIAAAARLAEIIAAEERGEQPIVQFLAAERFVCAYGPTQIWPFTRTPEAVLESHKTKIVG